MEVWTPSTNRIETNHVDLKTSAVIIKVVLDK